MAAIGLQSDGSVKRLAFTEDDCKARTLFSEWLIAAGASVRIDAAGNLIGRLEGTDPGLPALVTGSHLDTCLLYTSPSPRDGLLSRMPSSA